MRNCRSAAFSAAVFVAAPTFAADLDHNVGKPPQEAMAQNNLGKAGLLRSYFESDQFGSVQWRVGQGRLTIGSAASSGRSYSDYRDGTTDMVVPLNLLFGLPDDESMIRLGVRGTFPNGADYLVEQDACGIGRVEMQYLRFPDENTMWALGGFVDYTHLDIEGSGNVTRLAGGLRADILTEFSDHWGVAGRAEYSWGESDLKIAAGPGLTLEHKQGDDRFYTQVELIGQLRSEDLALIPDGWVAHPALGIQFQYRSECTINRRSAT